MSNWEQKNEIGPATLKVADNLKVLRTARGLTVRDLSAKMEAEGVKFVPSGVSKIELGKRGVSVDLLAALAQALDVTPAQMLEEDCGGMLKRAGVAALIRAGVPAEAAPGAYDKGARA